MRKPRSIFVLLVLLGFSVSLAVPAEDLPETAYDESEALPCEGTALFSIEAPKAVGAAPTVANPLYFDAAAASCRTSQRRRAGTVRLVLDSLTILNCSLRC